LWGADDQSKLKTPVVFPVPIDTSRTVHAMICFMAGGKEMSSLAKAEGLVREERYETTK